MAAMSSFRMPQSLNSRLGVETGDTVLRHEMLQEQAASLTRMAEKTEKALAALRACDDEGRGEGRAEVLKAAADAVWCFLVQREVMGLRDRARVVADYDIPKEVMVRLGVR